MLSIFGRAGATPLVYRWCSDAQEGVGVALSIPTLGADVDLSASKLVVLAVKCGVRDRDMYTQCIFYATLCRMA